MSNTIKAVIKYMETGDVDENAPTKLLKVIDKLQTSNANYYCKFWESLQTFQTPKIASTNYVPETEVDEKDIEIRVMHQVDVD